MVGFRVDGGDFAIEGADAVGSVGGLDGEGGVGLGLGRELSGIWVLGRGSMVIVVEEVGVGIGRGFHFMGKRDDFGVRDCREWQLKTQF